MFCTNCGSQIPDGASFCTQCGKPVGAGAAPAAQPVQQVQPVQPAQQMVPAAQSAMQQQFQPVAPVPVGQPMNPGMGQQPAYGAGQAPVPPSQVPPAGAGVRGCFGSGWDDVKNSEGWFKRVALMALIDFVPILNWVNVGYGWNWGKEVPLGKHEGMSGKIVTGQNFKTGAFVFLLSLIAGIVLSIEGGILGFIPFIGLLAAIALGIFAGMFINLSFIRTAMFDKLGAAFELGKLFNGYSRNLGTLFCISVVPGLIACGFGIIIGLLFTLIAGLIGGTDFLAVMSAASRYGSYDRVPASLMYNMGGSVVIIAIFALVAGYVELVVYQFCQLVTQRAMGHYVARFVPEWGSEASYSQDQTGVPQGMRQPVAGAPVPPMSAASVAPAAQSPVAPVSSVAPVSPVTPVAPAASTSAAVQNAAPAVAGAAVGAAAIGAAAASGPLTEPEPPKASPFAYDEPYATDETSVLPEYPEDMDTIVQPELRADYDAFAPTPLLVPEPTPAPAVTAQPAPEPAPVETPAPTPVEPAPDDAVRLQPTVASGPLIGDDSDTMVLMGDTSASGSLSTSGALSQHTLQLTRANGDTCVLTAFPVTIGKGSEADLVIEGNNAISRVHARILRDGDVFAAEDLGSTNKTRIGSYELPPYTPTILSDGDVLKLGNEALKVKFV